MSLVFLCSLKNDDAEFSKRIKEVFNIYAVVRNIKSSKAQMKEELEKKEKAREKRQEALREYLSELDSKGIPIKERSSLESKWEKDHPLGSYEDVI